MATAATSGAAKRTTKELKEDELIKEFFKDNIRPFEEFVSLIDRFPTYLVIFLSRFQYCQRFAIEILSATNSVYAVFFALRLLLCSEPIEYDCVFYIERVAFVFAALSYSYGFLVCGIIASALYFFTNSLMIKSIFEQVNDWSSFLTLAHKKYLYITNRPDFNYNEESDSDHDGNESMPELENEPPPKVEVKQENEETLEETNVKLRENLLRKTYEYDYNDPYANSMSDEEADEDIAEEEEEEEEEEEKENPRRWEKEHPELGEYSVGLHCKELLLLLKEYEEHCVKLEEEKNDLSLKLQASTEYLEQYHEHCISIQKAYFEHRIMWDKEKRQLTAKIDEHDETLKYYQHIMQVSKNSNNSASSVANDSSVQLQANLASARASLYDYQTKYRNSINESEEKRLKWETERNELNAKLSAISSWYQYYVFATYDYQLQEHNLLVQRNDLYAKLHSANTSAEFYKACLDDSDEECLKLREENGSLSAKLFAETSSAEHYHNVIHELEEKNRKLEDEKNELVTKLCAAKAASALYRNYLHDVGSS